MASEPLIAVFVDFENLAIGARQDGGLRLAERDSGGELADARG